MIGVDPATARARRIVRRRPPPLLHTDALFLDIDGTLVQLAETPDSVDIDPFLGIALTETAAILGGAGIPTVIFGPRGAGLHSPVEYVELASVDECAYTLAALARQFLG